tara:strand:+ start:4743 stop:4982 length:240 start_codon:yes stop_codon:yes gene_type:complete
MNPRHIAALIVTGVGVPMAKDQIQINIPASDFSRLRAALCRVGCGHTPDAQEAALLHELMKILDSGQDQLLGGSLPFNR